MISLEFILSLSSAAVFLVSLLLLEVLGGPPARSDAQGLGVDPHFVGQVVGVVLHGSLGLLLLFDFI